MWFCAVLFLTGLAHSQAEFAGNLSPDIDEGAEDGGAGGHQAGVPEEAGVDGRVPEEAVYVVPSLRNGEDTLKSLKKAPRPMGKPQSVGFVPPREEEEKEPSEGNSIEQVVSSEKKVVTSIPTLPARCVYDFSRRNVD